MVLAVDNFKAKLRGGGARPNLFKATINFPAYAGGDVEITSFLCTAAQLPGSVMGVVTVPFRGRQLKIAGDRTFDSWTPTIINDTDFKVRNSMEAWMNGVNAHKANTGLVNPVDYQADLKVEQLDRDESVLKSYIFRGCFPTSVSPIDLSYGANDAIEEFQVEFQVQYWESDTTS
tara:strand:+ start:9521 stop:10045 length:525 start_codon:yes stop_codon:yes gene_type:complete